jgi:hypothetical protein
VSTLSPWLTTKVRPLVAILTWNRFTGTSRKAGIVADRRRNPKPGIVGLTLD